MLTSWFGNETGFRARCEPVMPSKTQQHGTVPLWIDKVPMADISGRSDAVPLSQVSAAVSCRC